MTNDKGAIVAHADQHKLHQTQLQHKPDDADGDHDMKVTRPRSCARRIACMTLALAVVASAILAAIFTFTQLDHQDRCFSRGSPFPSQPYKLFSTKTTYSAVFDALVARDTPPAHDPHLLPAIFNLTLTLAALNARLVSPQFGCQARQVHFVGRHAARFPNVKTIDHINTHLASVQSRIDLDKFAPHQPANNTNLADTNRSAADNHTQVCFNPLTQYKQWASFVAPEQENLLLDSGVAESDAIAQRIKHIYPHLFDANQTKITLGTTDKLRTAQTALSFIKLLDNYQLDFCSLDQFSLDASDKLKAQELKNNHCFSNLVDKFKLEKLAFHEKCEQFSTQPVKPDRLRAFGQWKRIDFIASAVSKRLRLSKEQHLNQDETQAIYDTCKFETAYAGSSIWCNLFAEDELKFIEYLDDVDDYFNLAYGHPNQARSACPVTTELMRSFKMAAVRRNSQNEAYYYFTHSQVIAKLLAASVDLENDPEYSTGNVLDHLRSHNVPKQRQWKSSIMTPFSANIIFTLYECPRTKSPSGAFDSASDSMEFNVSPFKVVASLNERPILLDGCKDYVCDLGELIEDGKINKEKKCKLEDICRKLYE